MTEEKKATDPAFWAERLVKGHEMNEPHHAIAWESKSWWKELNETSTDVLDQVLRYFTPNSVLDAGCGIGTMCEAIPSYISYVGVDFCPELIEEAKRNYPRHKFLVGNCMKLDFPDESFDLVFCRSLEGVIYDGHGMDGWLQVQEELLRISRTVLVSMGMYQAGRFDIINKAGARLLCINKGEPLPDYAVAKPEATQ